VISATQARHGSLVHDCCVPDLYQDKWITCTDDAIVIRWYYLWGPKSIPYTAIRSVQRVDIGIAHGTDRIWGSVNLQYWASLDPGRWGKAAALILDVGAWVEPFITPDDVPQVAEIIRQRSGLPWIPYAGLGPRI
jgi:hypothetical protein